MKLNRLKHFFSFYPAPSTFSSTHKAEHSFFGSAWHGTDRNEFKIIMPYDNTHETREPLKLDTVHSELKNSLSKLLITCCDYSDLSGKPNALLHKIPPHAWDYYHIKHQHLPFSTYPNTTDPWLLIDCLNTMQEASDRHEPIYIYHQKSSPRALILTTLFDCIQDKSVQKLLLQCNNQEKIRDIFKSLLSEEHYAMLTEEQKLLATQVLIEYCDSWRSNISMKERLVALETSNKVGAILYQYLQSNQYWFILDYSYRYPDTQPIIQNLARYLYQVAQRKENGTFVIEDVVQIMIAYLKKEGKHKDQAVIERFQSLQHACEEMVSTITPYPQPIQQMTLDFLNQILNASCSYKEKIESIKTTTNYLKNPTDEQQKEYEKKFHLINVNINLSMRIIGISMIALGIAIASVALIAGIVMSGVGLLAISLATVGAIGLGAFSCWIGKLIYQSGAPNQVSEFAYQLNDKIATSASL